ncbi:MAG: hypothetical protein ACOZF0_21215 [Thermodesulfobacteriota bacterium]
MQAITKGVINLVLNGFSGWGLSTMSEILQVRSEEATVEDVRRLGRSQLFQLYHAAEVPDFEAMKGEYRAEVLPVGPFAFVADFYTHKMFGPGRWLGKAFHPLLKTSGWGYNIFAGKKGGDIFRTCRMNTFLGLSNMDDRDAFHLDYSPWNGFLNYTMHDEIRKINDRLYLGMGYMSAGGGPLNPAPFLVFGEPTHWVGPDKD